MKRGALDKAKAYLEESITIRRACYGERHEAIASALANLAKVEAELGDDSAAEGDFGSAIELYRELVAPMHPALATSLYHYGEYLISRRRYRDALAPFREALTIREASLGPDNWRTGLVHCNIGAALMRDGDFAAAEAPLKRAYALLVAGRGESQLPPTIARKRLYELYQTWGKPELAARYEPKP